MGIWVSNNNTPVCMTHDQSSSDDSKAQSVPENPFLFQHSLSYLNSHSFIICGGESSPLLKSTHAPRATAINDMPAQMPADDDSPIPCSH